MNNGVELRLRILFLVFFTWSPLIACAKPATRTPEEDQVIDTYKRLNRGVVFISTVTLTIDPYDMFASVKPQEGSGSGLVVDAERGIVVTNLHVIQNAAKIEVHLNDHGGMNGRLLGYDQEYDLAVLKIDSPPQDLVSIPFGNSAEIEVGQKVLAIGNPFGLNRTLTAGIISSLGRSVRGANGIVMHDLIQTDAAINPGNSGGPLLDTEGNLIGINTAILSQSGDSAGIGFAIPVNQIKRILPDLIINGKVLKPRVGWVLADTSQGPMVRRLLSGGPADRAGVQPIERPVSNAFLRGYVRDFLRADVIVSVDGKKVYSKDEVDELVAQSAGKELNFTLRLGGSKELREVKIKPELQ